LEESADPLLAQKSPFEGGKTKIFCIFALLRTLRNVPPPFPIKVRRFRKKSKFYEVRKKSENFKIFARGKNSLLQFWKFLKYLKVNLKEKVRGPSRKIFYSKNREKICEKICENVKMKKISKNKKSHF